MPTNNELIDELVKLLNGGSAHASFDDAIEGLTLKQSGEKVNSLPYTIWQLIEHIRIAQLDMLEFSKNADHNSPKWPEEYWVKETAPKNRETWDHSINQIKINLREFVELIKKSDLHKTIPHGNGQTLLREALQIADHTAYHTAEIIVIRRLLNAWK